MDNDIKILSFILFCFIIFLFVKILDKTMDMKERIAKLEVKVEKLEEK